MNKNSQFSNGKTQIYGWFDSSSPHPSPHNVPGSICFSPRVGQLSVPAALTSAVVQFFLSMDRGGELAAATILPSPPSLPSLPLRLG